MDRRISNILQDKIEDIKKLQDMVEVLHIEEPKPKTVDKTPAPTTGKKDYKKMYGIKS